MARFKKLDDARKAYFKGKITPEEYSAWLRKNLIADETRRKNNRKSKKIERKLETV